MGYGTQSGSTSAQADGGAFNSRAGWARYSNLAAEYANAAAASAAEAASAVVDAQVAVDAAAAAEQSAIDAANASRLTAGTITTGAPGSSASVSITGVAGAQVLDLTIPRGDIGATGSSGAAATVTVGTTTTLPAGSPATVTNVGTSSAAVFDFGVPKGADGVGSGSVTSVSIASANGFSGTVATPTSTPAITITTGVNGITKGNGTGLSAAVAGTDYVAPGGALGTPTSGNATNLTNTIAPQTAAATSKTAPVDADEIPITDSVASFGLKKLTWANLKSTVKTYFDTLYASLAGNTFTGAQVYSDQQLSRGMFKDVGEVFLDKGNSGTSAQTLDYTSGSVQRLTVTGAFTLNAVANWPPAGNLGALTLELVNGASSVVTWPTINWVKSDGSFTTTFASNGVTLQASGTDFVLLWSRDGGTTVYGKIMR